MKICSKCKIEKDKSFFSKDIRYRDNLYPWCKPCKTQHKRDRRDKIGRDNERQQWLRKKYNLSLEDYNLMLSEQEGGCLICGSTYTYPNGKLVVDHDEVTGKVRGLLCQNCNKGIGLFKHNPVTLCVASNYLRGCPVK